MCLLSLRPSRLACWVLLSLMLAFASPFRATNKHKSPFTSTTAAPAHSSHSNRNNTTTKATSKGDNNNMPHPQQQQATAMDHLKMYFLLEMGKFRCYVSFLEGNLSIYAHAMPPCRKEFDALFLMTTAIRSSFMVLGHSAKLIDIGIHKIHANGTYIYLTHIHE